MGDIQGLLFSFLLVGVAVLLAYVSYRYLHVSSEVARKIIHILCSLWIFIPVYIMKSGWLILLGPVFFIFANAAFVYSGLGKYLGMGNRKRNNGLVYFPISLLIVSACYVSGHMKGGCAVAGILTMGLGDGFAALVGTRFGRHQYHIGSSQKSYEGSLTMFLVTFLVALLASKASCPAALAVALLATLAESLTPLGLDNLSVPLLTAFALEVLCAL